MTDIFTTLALTEHRATQDDRDHAYLRLNEAWEWTSTGSAGCADRSLAEVLQADQAAIWAVLERDPDTGGPEDLPGAVAEAVESLPAAADALRDYLVSQGYPAEPVTLTDLPPSLRALADLLL